MILYKIEHLVTGNLGENFFSFPEPLPVNKIIGKGETISIPVEFYPLTGGNMSAYISIKTNCNIINPPDYVADTVVLLTGSAYKTPVNIEHTLLPRINKCSSGVITVKFTNINKTEAIKIDSIKIA